MTTRQENLIAHVLYGIAADLDVHGHNAGMRVNVADRARRFALLELGVGDPYAKIPGQTGA